MATHQTHKDPVFTLYAHLGTRATFKEARRHTVQVCTYRPGFLEMRGPTVSDNGRDRSPSSSYNPLQNLRLAMSEVSPHAISNKSPNCDTCCTRSCFGDDAHITITPRNTRWRTPPRAQSPQTRNAWLVKTTDSLQNTPTRRNRTTNNLSRLQQEAGGSTRSKPESLQELPENTYLLEYAMELVSDSIKRASSTGTAAC